MRDARSVLDPQRMGGRSRVRSAERMCERSFLRGAWKGVRMTGPSIAALIGHHLTEAIRHLSAAAELSRELTREDANELARSLERMREAVRDARGDVEGDKP